MKRTALKDRQLPHYTRGEEIFHMVSHIVGGGFGIIVLAACLIKSTLAHNPWAVVGSTVYGTAMIALYTISGIYHGLKPKMGKKVMQVLDHCTIYFLIAGTYTPILFCAIRHVSPLWCWILFALQWGLTAVATVFTAIDLKKYAVFSMICYIGMGWSVVLAAKPTIAAIPAAGLWWLLAGGISYTVGAVLYGLGRTHRWMHAVFHLFVVFGSVLQFVCIFWYVL